WAEPHAEHLRFLMRHVWENPDEARQRGLAAAGEVAGRWTLEKAAARVRSRLAELVSPPESATDATGPLVTLLHRDP
ncbi:MAG: hypothetical protein M3011_14470, partial [Actinomycetota bacterium]|nr:hypothetical protein [Actinomycetota bacterium]